MSRKYSHYTVDVYGLDVYVATTRKLLRRVQKDVAPWLRPPVRGAAGRTAFATRKSDERTRRAIAARTLVQYVDVAGHPTVSDLGDTITHEAFHGASFVTDNIAHFVSADDDEAGAYLAGLLAKFMWATIEDTHPGHIATLATAGDGSAA